MARVLPEYRRAQDAGQIEISTTPFYHPILPLICNSDIARVANPRHAAPSSSLFSTWRMLASNSSAPASITNGCSADLQSGCWPSEGSVSDQALGLAAELGFWRWFATDEGVLGRTLNIGFGRDGDGVPSNADRIYAPLRVRLGEREMVGFFRDHYLSDLVGFVYSRMDAGAAADDLYRRLRAIGERVQIGRPLTVSLILDGENAWEYYYRNGREFLRQFYRRISDDPDIIPLTVSEAVQAAGDIATVPGIFPASWISANFDVWIGHQEDVKGWDLLRAARDFYTKAVEKRTRGEEGAPTEVQTAAAYEALLAAEGSDWCWWFGPEHSSANDAEFDAFYRQLLSEVYSSLGAQAPDELAQPIKRQPEHADVISPSAFLKVTVDGRETNYFEWLGAGFYSPERRDSSMHGRVCMLHQLRYGFGDDHFYVRVDVFEGVFASLHDAEFRITLRGERVNSPRCRSESRKGSSPATWPKLRTSACLARTKWSRSPAIEFWRCPSRAGC